MKQNSKEELIRNVLLGGVIFVLVLILVFSSFYQKGVFNSKVENPQNKNESTPSPEPIVTPFEDNKRTPPLVVPSEKPISPSISPPPAVPTIPKEEATTFKSETELISYMNEQENFLVKNQNKNDVIVIGKVKEIFVKFVDFLFYDKPMGGYTFKELTTSAKLQVIKIVLSVDHKIDQYFPSYKESIKKGYENIKSKSMKLYLDLTSSLCATVGDRTCNQAKDDFATMKKSFGVTFDLLKEAGGNLVDSIRTWYEIFREN